MIVNKPKSKNGLGKRIVIKMKLKNLILVEILESFTFINWNLYVEPVFTES